ncbi:DUF202 domain-containing protein [Gordonia sp. KTR9]|uniref:DUF202 domain-containing protein n=1 Tax=Gordonia sp. KTR9 TaxID=337191 RepID=UPI00027DE1F1|nr:DUF202 domain-containing protein [Gordonia sp. KTR9]AFR51291.1 hypothetical protein KTR9_4689 [Gordonia sp. KTR9]
MTAAGAPPPRITDGGLQVERTSLAWQRTGCSIVVLVGVGVRLAAHLDSAWITTVVSMVGLVAALAVLTIIRQTMPDRRALALDNDTGQVYVRSTAATRGLLMSAVVAAMGAAALLGVLAMAFAGR